MPAQLGEHLTQRETQVILLIADGLSSKRVGKKLGISSRTVESHRGSIIAKLGAENITHAVSLSTHRCKYVGPWTPNHPCPLMCRSEVRMSEIGCGMFFD